jgi:hypothetical protein
MKILEFGRTWLRTRERCKDYFEDEKGNVHLIGANGKVRRIVYKYGKGAFHWFKEVHADYPKPQIIKDVEKNMRLHRLACSRTTPSHGVDVG